MSAARDRRSATGQKGAAATERRSATMPFTFAAYAHPSQQREYVRRGELLNLLAMVAYHRRETTWWRRLWRWVRGWPPVQPIDRVLAAAYAERIEALVTQLHEDHREEAQEP